MTYEFDVVLRVKVSAGNKEEALRMVRDDAKSIRDSTRPESAGTYSRATRALARLVLPR